MQRVKHNNDKLNKQKTKHISFIGFRVGLINEYI